MFRKTPSETPPDKVNTVIGKETFFKGSIRAKGLIRIDGEMDGEIETQGDVVIGEGGKVKVDLKARHVAIAGKYEGNLEAEGKLEIKKSGIVVGTVKANGLLIDDGAIFSGSIEMSQGDQPNLSLLKQNAGDSPAKI